MKYRFAAFDFDGTLADSFGWLVGVMGGVAERYGFAPGGKGGGIDLAGLRGLNSRQALARLRLPVWKVPLVAAHVRRLQARDIDRIALFDGVDEMLRRLHAGGVVVAVVSSNAEANVRRVLGEAAGRVSRFGCGASLFGKAARLRAVLRAARVPPAQAIYAGDETRDIEAARAAGMVSGAVSWGYATPQALRSASPTEFFDRPAEIADRLTRPDG